MSAIPGERVNAGDSMSNARVRTHTRIEDVTSVHPFTRHCPGQACSHWRCDARTCTCPVCECETCTVRHVTVTFDATELR